MRMDAKANNKILRIRKLFRFDSVSSTDSTLLKSHNIFSINNIQL